MCGRFININEQKKISKIFAISRTENYAENSYNIAPGQKINIIHYDSEQRIIDSVNWGYSFLNSQTNILQSVINSRIETINTKLLFKDSYLKRKCIILANGYYEWKFSNNTKIPYYINIPVNEIMCFAGIWRNEIRNGKTIKVCSIITKSANSNISFIHNRMPFILSINESMEYLEDKTNAFSKNYSESSIESDLDFYKVSKFVNNPNNNSKACIIPLK
tara:strand:+ start:1026 stop:1682 length:657 start_codon:yes stop_codon:yes gene_type:complete